LPQFGYLDFTGIIVHQVVVLNGMASADRLPAPGATMLIPRQTATPTPVGLDLTLTAGGVIAPQVNIPGNAEIVQHTVIEGESMLSLAEQYKMTLEQLSQLNPDIGFYGCDFTNPSGGPNCSPALSVGQMVNVLAPTPTPTLSPTPSGNETATPTPTYIAPLAVFPPEGGIAPGQVFTLQWVSVGELRPDEVYFVEIKDTTNGASDTEATRDTFITLPASMIPSDGQTHTIQWSVGIAVRNPDGQSYRPVSDKTIRTFQWQSR
jgi:LysM domain-containing protein